MIRSLLVLFAFVLLGLSCFAQSSKPLSYKTQEDYCRDNPQMPTCIKGKPFKMTDLNGTYKMPTPSGAPAAPRTNRTTSDTRR